MAKKDTAATVLGMLSTTGASTRPTPDDDEPAGDATVAHQQAAAMVDESPVDERTTPTTGPRSPGPTSRKAAPPAARRRRASTPTGSSTGPAEVGSEVPRTLRLRASTAAALRDAWLAAKREDVLLSHQDFASDLLDAALTRSRTPGR